MTYTGFGNGGDGAATLSGTDAPIDSSCSGTSGTTSLSATNASFADEKLVLIHQSRGTSVGNWEINIIDSYVAGTITTLFDLVNTYTDSGASQAQVIQIPEYSQVTVSGTFTAKAWDGNVGGIIALFCSGEMDVSGTITASGKGFRGGDAYTASAGQNGNQGESNLAVGAHAITNNGMGGGGGDHDSGNRGGGGGGGGHSENGVDGGDSASGGEGIQVGGTGGSTGGNTDLTVSMVFGGGGGSGSANASNTALAGANGGGIIFIMTARIVITGSIQSNGANGSNAATGRTGSGAGAGGSIYIVFVRADIGSNLISTIGGIGGSALDPNFEPSGGDGGDGRQHLIGCDITGTTNQGSVNQEIGGHDFCQSFISIY